MAKSPAYRLRFFNGTRITGETRFPCTSDDAAQDFASKVRLVSSVEVWNGNRRVCQMRAGDRDKAERAGQESASARNTVAARHHAQASRLLLSENRRSNNHLIEESVATLEDSRRLLRRPFVSPFRPSVQPRDGSNRQKDLAEPV